MVAVSTNDANDELEIMTNVDNLSKRNIVDSVDYDKNPTKLFKLLQARRWMDVLKHISESASEVPTWVFQNDIGGKKCWWMLPIHASIVFGAPYKVIVKLLSKYPNGIGCKDDQGMLPLHLAIKSGSSDDVIHELVKCFPEGVTEKNHEGRIPLELLATGGDTLPIDPPVECTDGCRVLPHCMNHPIGDMLSELDYTLSSTSFENTAKRDVIALYLDAVVESERGRIKDELKMKCPKDEFNAKASQLKKDVNFEINELKVAYAAELDTLKEYQAENIKAIIVRKRFETARKMEKMKQAHLKEIGIKAQEKKKLQERHKEKLARKLDEKGKLCEAHAENLKNIVSEINMLTQYGVEELKKG